MINGNLASESGTDRRFVLIRGAIAAGAFMMMAAVGMLMPTAAATPGVSPETTAVSDSDTAYFPAQYVNQATEIEPMPPTF